MYNILFAATNEECSQYMEGIIDKFPFLKENQLMLSHAEHLVGFNHEQRLKSCMETLVEKGELYYCALIANKETFTPYYRKPEEGRKKLELIFQVFFFILFWKNMSF